MFKFRGQRNNGEWVVGHYVAIWDSQYNHYNHYIYTGNDRAIDDYRDGFVDERLLVKPETLSVSFGKLDSTGTEIFASFEVDGVMTDGGDVAEVKGLEGFKYGIKYSLNGCGFMIYRTGCDTGLVMSIISSISNINSSELTIIGKGGGNDK